MTSIPQLQEHSPNEAAALVSSHCEQCVRQLTAAERELGAFLMAVQRLYGENAVAQATDEWIAAAAGTHLSSVDGRPNWRSITILASSNLAMERFRQGTRGSSQEEE